jgi:hypothetical protein
MNLARGPFIDIDPIDPVGASTMMRDVVHLGDAEYIAFFTAGPLHAAFFDRAHPDTLRPAFLAAMQRLVRQAGFFGQVATLANIARSIDPTRYPDRYTFDCLGTRNGQSIFRFVVQCTAQRGAPIRVLRGYRYPRFDECRVYRAYSFACDGTEVAWESDQVQTCSRP